MKLKIGFVLVCITILATMRDPQPVTYLLNQLGGLKHYFNASHDPTSDLSPTNWGPTPPTIQHREWWSINTSMITVVVGELCQWKVSIPTPSEIHHTIPKHILECLDCPLTVGLGVVCCTKMQLVPNSSWNFLQKLDVKRTSRYETIDTGTPCLTTTSQT